MTQIHSPFALRTRQAGRVEALFYAFAICMAAGPFDRFIMEDSLSPLVRALAWAIIYGGFFAMMATHPWPTVRSIRAVWPLLLMPGLALLSVLWSGLPQQTATGSLQLGSMVVFGAFLGWRVDENRLLGLVVAVLALLAAANFVLVFASPYGVDLNGNAVGLFAHKNTNGETMAKLVAAASAVLVWGGSHRGPSSSRPDQSDKGSRRWALIGLALAIPMLAMSGSRTAWGAAVIGVVVVISLKARRFGVARRQWLGLSGLAVFCLAAVLWLVSGNDLVALVLEAADKDTTLTGRTDLWELAQGFFARAPILGHGYDGFWSDDATSDGAFVNSVLDSVINAAAAGNLRSFHNGFLEMAVELGFVGAALEAVLIAAVLVPVSRLLRLGRPAAAAFACALLIQVTLTNFSEVTVFVRHGFNLLLFSAFWARAGMLHQQKAGRGIEPLPSP